MIERHDRTESDYGTDRDWPRRSYPDLILGVQEDFDINHIAHRLIQHPIQFEGALTFNFRIGTFLMGRLLNPATARSRGLMIDLLA